MTQQFPPVWPNPDEQVVRCSRLTRPILSGMFVNLTRQLYYDPEMQSDSLIKTWNAEEQNLPESDFLWIDATGVWEDKETSRRPAVFVDLGDLMYDPQGRQGLDQRSGFLMKDSEIWQARKAVCSVVWFHIGANFGEAELYGSNTLDLIDGYSYVIRRAFGFERFTVRGIFRPAQRKDSPKEWECRVQADFQFEETFMLQQEQPKLKQLTLDTNVFNQDFHMTT